MRKEVEAVQKLAGIATGLAGQPLAPSYVELASVVASSNISATPIGGKSAPCLSIFQNCSSSEVQ